MPKSLKDFIGRSRSIRVQDEQGLDGLGRIDSVAIVGSTCSGKSTLVDTIRHAVALKGLADVPMRYITRPSVVKTILLKILILMMMNFRQK